MKRDPPATARCRGRLRGQALRRGFAGWSVIHPSRTSVDKRPTCPHLPLRSRVRVTTPPARPSKRRTCPHPYFRSRVRVPTPPARPSRRRTRPRLHLVSGCGNHPTGMSVDKRRTCPRPYFRSRVRQLPHRHVRRQAPDVPPHPPSCPPGSADRPRVAGCQGTSCAPPRTKSARKAGHAGNPISTPLIPPPLAPVTLQAGPPVVRGAPPHHLARGKETPKAHAGQVSRLRGFAVTTERTERCTACAHYRVP